MTASASKPFILKRVFDAPRDAVWKAWTDAEALAQWFAPKGFKTATHKLDLLPGGVYHYHLKDKDGIEMWGKWSFREIAAPERLVMVISFSDEACGITRHPFAPDWPLETLSTTTFSEEDGRTIVTTQWETLNATTAEQATFDNGHAGMNQGWGGTMDQLEEFLRP